MHERRGGWPRLRQNDGRKGQLFMCVLSGLPSLYATGIILQSNTKCEVIFRCTCINRQEEKKVATSPNGNDHLKRRNILTSTRIISRNYSWCCCIHEQGLIRAWDSSTPVVHRISLLKDEPANKTSTLSPFRLAAPAPKRAAAVAASSYTATTQK